MTGPDRTPERRGRWLALLAVPVLCCAGPALLAAVGVGSVGALAGAVTGGVTLVAAGLVVAGGSAAVLLWRRRRIR